MQYLKSWFFAVLALTAVSAWGQDSCAPFSGSIQASHSGAWVGTGWYTIGQSQPLTAKAVVVNTGVAKKDGDFWLGTETATLDFGDGDTLQLITSFVTDHMTNPSGVFRVTEVGLFANGTGRFMYANGVFYSPGSFGPGLSSDGKTLNWSGEYQGTICGVDASKLAEKVKKNAAPRGQSAAAEARR